MPGGVPDTTPRFNLDYSTKQNWIDKTTTGELPGYI